MTVPLYPSRGVSRISPSSPSVTVRAVDTRRRQRPLPWNSHENCFVQHQRLTSQTSPASAIIEKHQPDVIGLQETKVADEQFPQAEIEALGYHVHYHGQKGHYRVALLSRQAPLEVHKGFPSDGEESQKRFIWGRFADANGQPVTVMNGYFPRAKAAPIR